MARTTPVSEQRIEEMIRDARLHGAILDYSPASAAGIDAYIESVEQEVRIALDLDDGAYVGDSAPAMLDLEALGTYYGELFVRHAGAAWGTREGEDGPELAVVRGAVSELPLTRVRIRATDGPPPVFRTLFPELAAEMRAAA
jgi:hypothetical protein